MGRSAMLLGLVLGLTMAVIAVGCGGGEGDTAGADSLSRAEFVRQANALCREERVGLSKEAARVFARERSRGYSHDVVLGEVAHYVLLPAIENEISQIRYLAIPPADKSGIEAGLSAERLAIDKIASAGKLESMAEFHRLFAESGIQLRANGLNACTNDR